MDEQLSLLGEPVAVDGETASLRKKKVVQKKTSVKNITESKITEVKPPAIKSPRPKISPRKEPASSGLEELLYEQLVSGLKKFLETQNFQKGVLGLSGGVDSSLTLKIAVEALGKENVIALVMPELGLTKQENIDHAKMLASYFGVTTYYQPINTLLMDFRLMPWKPNNRALMNTKARIRMSLLYNYANSEHALVLGTSNRSELLLGYATKFGDMACDVEIIGDLYKTEVTMMADAVGLPPEITHKTPTAELSEGQTDEGELGATYQDLDKVLMKHSLGLDGCIDHGLPAALVHKVFRLVEANKHKLQMPFVIPVTRPS